MWTKYAIIMAHKSLINKKICIKLFLRQGNRVKTFSVKHRPSTELSSYLTSSEMFQMDVLQTQNEYSSCFPKSNRNYDLVESQIFFFGLLMN